MGFENESKLKANRTADEAKVNTEGHKPYDHQHYPKWVYGAAGTSALVHSEGEHKALVGRWFEHPKEAEEYSRKLADEASKAAATEAKAKADSKTKPKPVQGADEASKADEVKA